jgi:PhoD-like phosphatase
MRLFRSCFSRHRANRSVRLAVDKDISANDSSLFRNAMSNVVRNRDASKLFSAFQVSYEFDDHDFGSNNADSFSPSKVAALTNYQAMVPRAPTLSPDNGVITDTLINYHAYTVGRVRVVVTDLRSQSDKAGGKVMDEAQLTWLLAEFSRAAKYGVVVWASTRPWIGPEDSTVDHWGAFPAQRRTIADYLATHKVTNLVIVSGDTHMLAADDGTNSDYASPGMPPAGFPVLQSSPLANYGSSKGGPFSEGCVAVRFGVNYNYATLSISKLGQVGGPCIAYRGYTTADSTARIAFDKCGQLGGVDGKEGGGAGPKCKIKLAPAWVYAVFAVGIIALLIFIGLVVLCCCRRMKNRKGASAVA